MVKRARVGPARARRIGASTLVAATIALVACSDAPGTSPATTVATTIAPTTTVEPDDGVLRIGVLLPLSGPGAVIGQSMHDAVLLAVQQANDAGGVGGGPIEVTVADEGDGPVSAARGLEELLAEDVDAVVGPGSSLVALDLLVTLRRERLVTCSPSATALALDDFPDDGLFFRTVPSDSVQAEAMARAIDLTGRSSVAILYVDDAYGRALTDSLTMQLAGHTVPVVDLVPFRVDDADFADEVETVVESGAQVIAVIGDAAEGPRMIAAVVEGSEDDTIPIFINDTMRGPSTGSVLRQLAPGATERVRGVGLRVTSDNSEFLATFRGAFPDASGYLAVNAFECANLIALASTAAGSTRSTDIAGRMTIVSAGGQPCASFADCRAALQQGRNVDYDGPSGALQLSPEGELHRGTYDLFAFDSAGGERVLSTLTVGTDQPGPSL
jgi:branched-chain amino acid transport system substrate-binding protein